MKCIDFDSHFNKYVQHWMTENRSKYKKPKRSLVEKVGVCYNQHRKIIVKRAEGWYEEETA